LRELKKKDNGLVIAGSDVDCAVGSASWRPVRVCVRVSLSIFKFPPVFAQKQKQR